MWHSIQNSEFSAGSSGWDPLFLNQRPVMIVSPAYIRMVTVPELGCKFTINNRLDWKCDDAFKDVNDVAYIAGLIVAGSVW